jgi:hypothetical protein
MQRGTLRARVLQPMSRCHRRRWVDAEAVVAPGELEHVALPARRDPDVPGGLASIPTTTGVGAATFNGDVYVFWQGVNSS